MLFSILTCSRLNTSRSTSSSSPGVQSWTQLVILPQLHAKWCIEFAIQSHIPSNRLPPDWMPTSTPSSSLDGSLQVYIKTHSISTSKSISNFTQLLPSSSISSSLQYHLQLSQQQYVVATLNYICRFTRLIISSVHDHCLKLRFPLTWSSLSCNYHHSHSHSLKVYLKSHSNIISKIVWYLPSVSQHFLYNSIQGNLKICTIVASMSISKLTQLQP